MNSFVLGAGPVGLLASHLLCLPCIGARRGGSSDLRRLAPTHLWHSNKLEAVLSSLGLSTEVEEVRFAFWGPRGVSQEVSESERQNYLRRSGRGSDAPTSAISSGAKGSLTCFKTTVDELCGALLASVELREEKVHWIKVDLLEGRLLLGLDRGETSSTLLVNTLPAPTFEDLLRGPFVQRPWESGRKVFVEGMAWADPLRLAREAGLRWLYVTDPQIPFDRVNILSDGYSYEFNGACPDWFPEAVNGRVVLDAPLQVLGTPREEFSLGGLVRHVGRMARWDHRIRLHNVAEVLGEVL